MSISSYSWYFKSFMHQFVRSNAGIMINYQFGDYWFKTTMVVSWLDQSKAYQEVLGTYWLIVNCLLEMTVQGWAFECSPLEVAIKFLFFPEVTRFLSKKQTERNLAKWIKFEWVSLPAVGYKILNSTLSPQGICHFGSVNTMKQFV